MAEVRPYSCDGLPLLLLAPCELCSAPCSNPPPAAAVCNPQGAGGFAGAPLSSNQGFLQNAQQKQQQAAFNQQQQQPVGQGGGYGGLQQLGSAGPFAAPAGMQSAPGSSMQAPLSSVVSMDGQHQQG